MFNPNISIMQGRLLPPFEERFQAYPANDWINEFYKAAEIGLYSIEWIYEKPHEVENAFYNDLGIEKIKQTIDDTGILVRSICADYYMSEHLIKDGSTVLTNWEHLEWLYNQAKKLKITYIILPFVDNSSLQSEEDIQALILALKNFFNNNESLGIEIHLETDLEPHNFYQLFKKVNNPLLKMNYDTGNSASLGYDPDLEFDLLGNYLGSVHIKDRVVRGKTVSLGTGDTDFNKCFNWFKKLKFDRWYVLQAARGQSGLESQNIMSQLNFILNYCTNT